MSAAAGARDSPPLGYPNGQRIWSEASLQGDLGFDCIAEPGPASWEAELEFEKGFVVVLHVCVCVCVHSRVRAQMCHRTRVKVRGQCWVLSTLSKAGSFLLFASGSTVYSRLAEPWTSWANYLFLISIGVLDLQTQDDSMPNFQTRSWDLNSGHRAWEASTFTTEPIPWPKKRI